jgi:hypothetical protein
MKTKSKIVKHLQHNKLHASFAASSELNGYVRALEWVLDGDVAAEELGGEL